MCCILVPLCLTNVMSAHCFICNTRFSIRWPFFFTSTLISCFLPGLIFLFYIFVYLKTCIPFMIHFASFCFIPPQNHFVQGFKPPLKRRYVSNHQFSIITQNKRFVLRALSGNSVGEYLIRFSTTMPQKCWFDIKS